MQTLQIDETKAKSLYKTASAEFKTMLEDSFGGKQFFSEKITDRVKTFEDACNVTGDYPKSDRFTEGTTDEIAYKKLKVIIAALNEGWTPDWNNSNEVKYYPWFEMRSGFRLTYVFDYYRASNVGSRLCFRTRDLANYAVSQFPDLYKDFFTA